MTDNSPINNDKNGESERHLRNIMEGAGYVPKKDLEALVEEWRERRDGRDRNTMSNIATLAFEQCADELEEVLEQHD